MPRPIVSAEAVTLPTPRLPTRARAVGVQICSRAAAWIGSVRSKPVQYLPSFWKSYVPALVTTWPSTTTSSGIVTVVAAWRVWYVIVAIWYMYSLAVLTSGSFGLSSDLSTA